MLTHLCCVHDAHVHALQAGVVQEGAMEGAAHRLVATEGEGNVGHTAADLAAGAHTLDLAGSAEEVNCVVVVLSHACANCENVGVEDDVLGLKANVLHKDAVGTLAHADLQRMHSSGVYADQKGARIVTVPCSHVDIASASVHWCTAW